MDFQLRLTGRRQITRQIFDQIRAAILDGRLQRGTQLPSTRTLASQLNVVRKTVVLAYDMLMAEGLVASRAGSGTYVEDLALAERHGAAASTLVEVAPPWQERPDLPTFPRPPVQFDFGIGVPELRRFPWELWRSLSASRLRQMRESDHSYLNPQGHPALREAVAGFVGFSRAVHSVPNDVLITNGAQQAFQLISQTMIRPGTVVAMENPGYPMARWIFSAHGARVVDVPVDREGMVLSRLPRNTKLIYTTPSHQFPTGVVMSLERRVRLLEWARRRRVAVIEDDYDSEFRFDGRPLESLQSLDPPVVIYVGTFSKSLFPGIRLGFIIAPHPLRDALLVAKHLSDWHSPFLTQATVAAFIADGHYTRHIRRFRRLYSERRTRLTGEIEGHLAEWLELLPSTTGLHLAAVLKHDLDPQTIADAALADGVRIFPMPGGLTFGIGSIDASHIKEATEILRTVIRAQLRRNRTTASSSLG